MSAREPPSDSRWDYDQAIRVESDFTLPDLSPDVDVLTRHFASERARERRPLRNYHHEAPVTDPVRARARPSAVLIPIVERESGLQLLLTRRHPDISYPGHVCFPGGRVDDSDAHAEAAALREAHEEIGVRPELVRVLGHLGEYYTQSGHRIDPIVGLLTPPLDLEPAPHEVTEIVEIPLAFVMRAASYELWRPTPEHRSAYFSLIFEEINVTGPTACMLMGFYEELAATASEGTDTGLFED